MMGCVLVLIIQTARLFKSLGRIAASDEGQGVGILLALQLVLGAVFLVVTGGKIFPMVYLVTGIGLFVSFGALVARQLLDERVRREKGGEEQA